MNCVFPPELNDQQLIAYLDDPKANQATGRHLEQCPHCQQKAQSLERFQKRLRTRLYRSTCPTPMELGEFYLHALPAAQRLVIAQHLRECIHCSQELSELEVFLSESPHKVGLSEPVRVLIAELVSGTQSFSTSAVPALRGETKGPLVFAADGTVITLDVQSGHNGQFLIQGQVATEDQDQWTGAAVRVQQAEMPDLIASLDELGAFDFEIDHPGSVQLKITSPDGIEIQILNIDIAV